MDAWIGYEQVHGWIFFFVLYWPFVLSALALTCSISHFIDYGKVRLDEIDTPITNLAREFRDAGSVMTQDAPLKLNDYNLPMESSTVIKVFHLATSPM